MENSSIILDILKKAGRPLKVSEIVQMSGLAQKDVDKAMKNLKSEGSIVSPARCLWEPAEKKIVCSEKE